MLVMVNFFKWWCKNSNITCQLEIVPIQNNVCFVLFSECIDTIFNKRDSNLFYVSIFIKYTGCYLVVIGRHKSEEVMMYLFTREVIDVTTLKTSMIFGLTT